MTKAERRLLGTLTEIVELLIEPGATTYTQQQELLRKLAGARAECDGLIAEREGASAEPDADV